MNETILNIDNYEPQNLFIDVDKVQNIEFKFKDVIYKFNVQKFLDAFCEIGRFESRL